MVDIILIVLIALMLFFALKKSIGHFHGEGGCCGGSSVEKVKAEDTNVHHYNYHKTIYTEGMKCDGCKTRIENALNSRIGVYAIANYHKNEVVVHLKNDMSDEELKKIITDLGYSVKEIKSE